MPTHLTRPHRGCRLRDCGALLTALRLAVAEKRAARAAYDARDKSAIVGSAMEMTMLATLDEATRAVVRAAEDMAEAAAMEVEP